MSWKKWSYLDCLLGVNLSIWVDEQFNEVIIEIFIDDEIKY